MTSPKGYPIEGRREDIDSLNIELQPKHSTVIPKGTNRRALDTVSGGFFEVTVDAVIEAGSTDSLIIITGHTAKIGDLIRIKTVANPMQEFEMFVHEIVDANSFKLAGVLSALLTAGDLIDILRYVTEKLGPNGESLASVVSPPVKYLVDGAEVTVESSPIAGTYNPLPVEVSSVSGPINITAGDLNVQTSMVGANHDSMRVGDGTNEIFVKPDAGNPGFGEATVNDADANTTLTSIDTKVATQTTLEAARVLLASLDGKMNSLGQKAMAASMPVTLASDQSNLTINLPTNAATQTTLEAVRVLLNTISGLDFSTQTTLALANTNLGNILTKITSLETAVNVSSELDVKLADLNGAATEATLAALASEDFSTETTLAAQSAKLPAALGKQAAAGSMSVTLSNDEGSLPGTAFDMKSFVKLDMSVSNVTNAAYTTLIASVGASDTKQVNIFMSSGTPLLLATGAAASEVDKMIIPPGGFSVTMDLTVAAGTRLSVKSLGGTVSSGDIIINLMG